jgi:hypothetical protein
VDLVVAICSQDAAYSRYRIPARKRSSGLAAPAPGEVHDGWCDCREVLTAGCGGFFGLAEVLDAWGWVVVLCVVCVSADLLEGSVCCVL